MGKDKARIVDGAKLQIRISALGRHSLSEEQNWRLLARRFRQNKTIGCIAQQGQRRARKTFNYGARLTNR